MKRFWRKGIFFIFAGLVFLGKIPAGLSADGLQPLAESQAYQEYLKKPENSLSKAICLLNYFRTAPLMVQFDGVEYTPEFAYPFGLVYLMTNYRSEDPQQWAKRHCYRSLFTNRIIYFKFEDGTSRPARDVILEKFRELEEIQGKRVSQPPAN
jgi:hypothetical protein